MIPRNIHLYIGAVLSMVAAFMVIVQKWNIAGNVVFTVSNMFLYWYTVCAVVEMFRKAMNPEVD